MPEAQRTGELVTELSAGASDAGSGALDPAGEEPLRRLPYILGLALQVFLWMLVFLGIVIAVMVGGELTEFRYVGF